MYCQECGSKLPESAKFCSNCGTKVYVMPLHSEEVIEEAKAEVQEYREELQEVQEVPKEYSEEVQDDLSATEVNLLVKKLKKNNKKSKKKLLGIIAGVFVMLAVVVGGFFAYLENRTLYYLINPEMFFGECTDYVIFRSAPGRSWVELEFESETDFFDNVLKYVDCVEMLNPDLEVYNNTLDITEGWRSVYWRVDEDEFFWHEYSLGDTGLFDVGISYQPIPVS